MNGEKTINSYEDLIVWQRAIELVITTYEFTSHFPKEEMFGLISQMRRASISIPSNIAEGSRRGSRKDFRHFSLNAFGSGAELETQIKISKKLGFLPETDYSKVDALLGEVMKMLNKMIGNLDVVSS